MSIFLHIGKNESVPEKELVGIFNLDNITKQEATRDFLSGMERKRRLVSVFCDLPCSLVLCDNPFCDTAYISGISAPSLKRRAENR